jgi:transposase
MFAELFLPNTQLLSFEEIKIDANSILVTVTSAREYAKCPYCQASATRKHSRHFRTLSDLPCGDRAVKICWEAKRYFCDNNNCVRLTFCEQLPEVTARYARKTRRLMTKQLQIGFDLSAEAGNRLALLLNFGMSGDQIIRLVHSVPNPDTPTPRVLGIDDWAIRKGQTYGTILVDLEKQQVIDLLPDRKPETLAAWLIAHPGVEIISRDRGKEYIEGIALGGCQGVIEIADRFHLLKNMAEMLQRFFERVSNELKSAAKQNSFEEDVSLTTKSENDGIPDLQNDENAKDQSNEKSYQQTRFEEVKQLDAEGLSQRAIAKKVGVARQTVRKYIFSDTLPRKHQNIALWSKATPFINFIREHWDANNPSVKILFEEVQAQGFKGSYASLNRALHNQLGVENLKTFRSKAPKPLQYSPRQAAWAIFQPDESLKAPQKVLCQTLCELSPMVIQARQLAHAFREIVDKRQNDQLDQWLKEADSSQIVEFKRFADSLRKDYKAVKAALTYSWSNGQVEGQVNRLKVIKRQMYGRAGFPLLRRKVLGLPVVSW